MNAEIRDPSAQGQAEKNLILQSRPFEKVNHRSHNFILAQSKTQIVQAEHLLIPNRIPSFSYLFQNLLLLPCRSCP